jgi:hypothetical protein
MSEEIDNADVKANLTRRTDQLMEEAARLKTLAVAFERWHQDMISMTARNRDMDSQGEDLSTLARQLIMVSINAAIEAARAGDGASGFVVVAAETKSLAKRVQSISRDIAKNLNRTNLMNAATFQDIQAGGKMMMAAISGLELMIRQLRQEIG